MFFHAHVTDLVFKLCSYALILLREFSLRLSTYWPLLFIGRWISHINSSVSITYWLRLQIYSIVIQIVFPFWFYTSHISCWNTKQWHRFTILELASSHPNLSINEQYKEYDVILYHSLTNSSVDIGHKPVCLSIFSLICSTALIVHPFYISKT